jgi:hypothetical protein
MPVSEVVLDHTGKCDSCRIRAEELAENPHRRAFEREHRDFTLYDFIKEHAMFISSFAAFIALISPKYRLDLSRVSAGAGLMRSFTCPQRKVYDAPRTSDPASQRNS